MTSFQGFYDGSYNYTYLDAFKEKTPLQCPPTIISLCSPLFQKIICQAGCTSFMNTLRGTCFHPTEEACSKIDLQDRLACRQFVFSHCCPDYYPIQFIYGHTYARLFTYDAGNYITIRTGAIFIDSKWHHVIAMSCKYNGNLYYLK